MARARSDEESGWHDLQHIRMREDLARVVKTEDVDTGPIPVGIGAPHLVAAQDDEFARSRTGAPEYDYHHRSAQTRILSAGGLGQYIEHKKELFLC